MPVIGDYSAEGTPPDDPLRIEGLAVDLGGRAVLRSVGLTVRRGELVAVLGANGSGKSTLVRAAVGLIPFRAGTIDLFGSPVDAFTRRERLGYVPQRTASAAGVPATVREVIRSGLLARHPWHGVPTRAERAGISRAAEAMGLADMLTKQVAELSGGQQQRVLIARAIAGEPDLLVMDEPTAGVDRGHTERLAEFLAEFTERGGAVLMVEHDLGPIRPSVDRVVVLDHGRVAFAGPAEDVPERHGPHHHDTDVPAPPVVPGEGVL
ncbi:MAG TPA: metal ABC transporter ATP-binding protein [Aeromicrobium sp.]|nr:metal ABC transporter ATP-binding protein [Aeromicrobium sp.]HKY58833.1 metal ABC transporter ATP-binding protein [Aeromicrobium sp.]